MNYLIQASTSHESNLCFSKSSEKLSEMTKIFLGQKSQWKILSVFWTTCKETLNLRGNFRKKLD